MFSSLTSKVALATFSLGGLVGISYSLKDYLTSGKDSQALKNAILETVSFASQGKKCQRIFVDNQKEEVPEWGCESWAEKDTFSLEGIEAKEKEIVRGVKEEVEKKLKSRNWKNPEESLSENEEDWSVDEWTCKSRKQEDNRFEVVCIKK